MTARERCSTHYWRWYRSNPGRVTRKPRGPAAQRFWAKVAEAESGCWLWQGALSNGYGTFNVTKGSTVSAHRWAYEHLVGPVPDGLELDHLCRTPACVNPEHLDPVPSAVNAARAHVHQKPKTHCPKGHPYDETNTLIGPHGWRYCIACRAEQARERAARKREEARLRRNAKIAELVARRKSEAS